MADILAVMNEQNNVNEENQVRKVLVENHETENLSHAFSWVQNFKIIGLVTTIAGFAWVACTYCGGSTCIANCVPLLAIWCYTKNISQPKPTSQNQLIEEMELQELPPTSI